MHDNRDTHRPAPDNLLTAIADYVLDATDPSAEALNTAHYCLLDSLGCAMLALQYPACVKLLGPMVEGTSCDYGTRIPGTNFKLDPVQAAFNIGSMIRWLDYNDTWLAAEWGHPSDNLGGILAVADYINQQRLAQKQSPLLVKDILHALVKAYEIQGILALDNSFNRVGLDHVILVRIATTAVVCAMLGGSREQIINALSNAWIDGGALRTYRQAPNTGSRKSWAAGDATSRGVWHALMALKNEMGYPSALTAPQWGFQEVLFQGNAITLPQPFGNYVMENILFKVAFPAEFHAQTAVEAAIQLHPDVKMRLNDIKQIQIRTQQAAIRIIDKTGPLNNPADRDHCLQYVVAVALLKGQLTADDYEDAAASDPRIDELRNKMQVLENPVYSADYLDPAKRYIANAIQIFFADGSSTHLAEMHYPVGHRQRRDEAVPLLRNKLVTNIQSTAHPETILDSYDHPEILSVMNVSDFLALF